jgi:hypothetical protein
MKKLILSTIVTLLFTVTAFSQSPIIEDFRNIISKNNTNFSSFKKDFIDENKDKGIKIYTTNLDLSPICGGIVIDEKDQNSKLVLNYELNRMDDMMFKIFTTMVPQYINEMNDMIKTGKYTGSESTVDGLSITTIKDVKGNKIVEYSSDQFEHRIIFYGNISK